jgi:thiosulfate/3-mercaptopyruvate sulfurtransferase
MKLTAIAGRGLSIGLWTIALLFGWCSSPAQETTATSGPGSALSIPKAQLIQPEDLQRLIQSGSADKPLVVQVGSHVLYAEAHIPGSTYAGPGSQAAGLQGLKSLLASHSRKQFIVLYCGCCPWTHCPNIGPAYQQLRKMGFTDVKVLYLADNFGSDWVNKGYSVERGR